MLSRWKKALSKTHQQVAGALRAVFTSSGTLDEDSLEALEETLIRADVPARLAAEMVDAVREDDSVGHEGAHQRLRTLLLDALGPAGDAALEGDTTPVALLVVGVNGAGKTTTCAKLAHHVLQGGRQPLLGATDTFRAAGSDQLKLWADRLGCAVVGGKQGADAAAVAFDAADSAVARGVDVLILDTAGRMHTKQPLLEEMRKIHRALGKRIEGAPHEVWLVLDAAMGQNAITQAKVFHEVTPLTGLVVAKLDGSSKAGFLFSIAKDLGIPVQYIGLGEDAEDLVRFEPTEFVDALLGVAEVDAAL